MELEGKLSPKTAPKAILLWGPLKKTITPVRELQILSPSRILLYYRGASFNITLSKLVNSPFKERHTNKFSLCLNPYRVELPLPPSAPPTLPDFFFIYFFYSNVLIFLTQKFGAISKYLLSSLLAIKYNT